MFNKHEIWFPALRNHQLVHIESRLKAANQRWFPALRKQQLLCYYWEACKFNNVKRERNSLTFRKVGLACLGIGMLWQNWLIENWNLAKLVDWKLKSNKIDQLKIEKALRPQPLHPVLPPLIQFGRICSKFIKNIAKGNEKNGMDWSNTLFPLFVKYPKLSINSQRMSSQSEIWHNWMVGWMLDEVCLDFWGSVLRHCQGWTSINK